MPVNIPNPYAGTAVLDTNAADIQPLGVQAAGATGKAADAGHIHPAAGLWIPADNDLLGANFLLPAITSETNSMTAGTVYLSKLAVKQTFTIRFLWWLIGNAGSGSSSGSFAGLYDNTGTLLDQSADIGTNFTNFTNHMQLTSNVTITGGSTYWAALLSNMSVAQPQLCAGFDSDPGIATLNQGPGPDPGAFFCAVNGTGLTSLPGSINLNSNTISGAVPFWTGYSFVS